ncbi:MAG: class I SAM-dependent methyltransferase [Thermodesulfobacteriota bacterium]
MTRRPRRPRAKAVPARRFWDALTDYEQEIRSIFATDNVVTAALAAVPDKADKVVGDFGCGPGNAFPHLRDFRRVYGVDYSENMLGQAREKRQPNVELLQGRIEDMRLPEPCDLCLALASLMPMNLVHFHQMLDNLLSNTRENGQLMTVLPSLEFRTFAFQLEVDILADQGRDPADIVRALRKQIEAYQFNPLGYMLTDGGLVQKAWLREEIAYRLEKYGFKAVEIRKLELDWERQIKRPDLGHLPRPWLWFVHITR